MREMFKSTYELADALGRVFSAYANQVQNGAVQPYEALLTMDSVDVIFTITREGGLSVKPLTKEEPKREWIDDPKTGEAIGATIPLEVTEIKKVENPELNQVSCEVTMKPKRSRKKKEPIDEETLNTINDAFASASKRIEETSE